MILLLCLSAWAAELPAVYGGPAPDPSAERAARAAAGTSEPARWLLEPVPPLLEGLYLFGAATPTPCRESPLSLAESNAAAAAALDLLDQILPDEASVAYETLAARLPCLTEPLDAHTLAQLQFHRGIAALTRADPDKALGLRAFAAAIAAEADTPWNEDYPAFPRSVFFEGKVRLLDAPRARLWVLDGAEVWLDGRLLPADDAGHSVLAGPHLLHVRRGETWWRGAVELAAGGDVVLSSADAVEAALLADDDPGEAARARVIRVAVGSAFGRTVALTRPGAWAALDPDGTLHPWSDEGAWRTRLGVTLGADGVYQDPTLDSPPVDVPNPSALWARPAVGLLIRFHPVLGARVGGGLAAAGPFRVDEHAWWRLVPFGRVGLSAEVPDGWLRPGAWLDLQVLTPGELSVAGERSNVVLFGPVAGVGLAARLRDELWVDLHASGGWVGSATAAIGLDVQLRMPPLQRRAIVR